MTAEDLDAAQKALEDLFVETDEQADKYIVERLKCQSERLVAYIMEFTGEKLRLRPTGDEEISRETVIEHIKSLYDNLIESVQAYFNGRFDKSRNIVYDNFFLLGRSRRNPLPEYKLNEKAAEEGVTFFRIRENDTYVLYKARDMFHIPFEKRGLVENQRFSISGYPCLYMGTSVYGCWEETRRPDVDMCNVIALRTKKQLKFISLCIPTINPEKGLYARMVYTFVLRLACSLKVQSPDDYFKPEYIIPQMVLSCIVRRNNEADEKFHYDGIRYTSNVYRQPQDMFHRKRLLLNYMIPIKESSETGLCGNLLELFEATETTSLINERLTRNAMMLTARRRVATELYQTTEFGLLEETLKGREFRKIEYRIPEPV